MSKIFFISGVNGVGKTSTMPFLISLLPKDEYEIHDFDERGVPENAGSEWRISETAYWLDEGLRLSRENKSLIVCGFVKPSDFPDSSDVDFSRIVMLLLDAQPEIIRQRLIERYSHNGFFDESQKVIGKPISVFIDGNLYILDQMKKKFEELDYPIIDTSNLTQEEVSKKIVKIILIKTVS